VQLIDRNTDTTYIVVGSEPFSPRMARPTGAATSQRLWMILGAALFVIAGPSVLDAVAQATLASARLLLEIGRMGLVAYEMFGK
jgi:hypothetical protein